MTRQTPILYLAIQSVVRPTITPPKVLWSQVVAADFLIQWFLSHLNLSDFPRASLTLWRVGWILTCDTTTAFLIFCEDVEIDAIGIRQKHSRKANCIAKGPGLLMQLLEFPFLSFSILFGNTYIYIHTIYIYIYTLHTYIYIYIYAPTTHTHTYIYIYIRSQYSIFH